MDKGDTYEVQLAELSDQLNTESEEKERLRASRDFCLGEMPGNLLLVQKESWERNRVVVG